MHKQWLNICFIFFVAYTYAQNKQLIYNFDQLPQTLMLNPGAVVDYNYHIGIPLISSIYFQAGFTNKNFNYNNIYGDSESAILRNINDIEELTTDDYLLLNQQLEIFYAGIRLKNPKHYLSFGMYEEIDGFSTYPDDIVKIYFYGDDRNNDGIPEFDRKTNFNQIDFLGEFIGVFHVGISSRINERLNVGLRLKLISGSLNVRSTNNEGYYQLSQSSETNLYHHNFNDMNTVVSSSGFRYLDPDALEGEASNSINGLFFGSGNFGMGLDLGITYEATERVSVTASLLNLDYINYTNDISNYSITEDFTLDDDEYFDPPLGGESNYWQNKITDYYDNGDIPIDTLRAGYSNFRNPILNTSARYIMYNNGKENESVFRNVNCYKCLSDENNFTSEIGIQTYTIFRPSKIGWAFTTYYSRSFNRYINAKISYTFSNFSPYNIGLGISTHFRRFNFYATMDNLLYLPRLKDSNYQSIQIGFNFIFE